MTATATRTTVRPNVAVAAAQCPTVEKPQPRAGFFATLLTNASTTELWGSVVKTTLFGAIIAIVSAYKGMNASGGAEGVGRAVNESVVITFMLLFVVNFVMSAIYFQLVPPKTG